MDGIKYHSGIGDDCHGGLFLAKGQERQGATSKGTKVGYIPTKGKDPRSIARRAGKEALKRRRDGLLRNGGEALIRLCQRASRQAAISQPKEGRGQRGEFKRTRKVNLSVIGHHNRTSGCSRGGDGSGAYPGKRWLL